jgi:predicted dehydrogenase
LAEIEEKHGSQTKMKIGIIGCGLIGRKRALSAQRLGLTIELVADTNIGRAQALATDFGARSTTRWEEVINSNIDIAVVATSHDQLAVISHQALLANKHVLFEKPGGRNAAELIPALETAKERSLVAKCGFNHRFHPGIIRAKEIVSSGELGPLMFIRGRYGHGGRLGYEEEWRCNETISGGGELIDQGSHLIDLSRWFMGDLYVDYGLALTTFWNIKVDDNCFLALRGTQGEVAWLHASWSEWKNMFSFEIYGKHGKVAVEGLGGSYGIEKITYYRMLPEMGPPETIAWEFPQPDSSWDKEFKNFIAAVRGESAASGTIEDAVANLQIIDEIYRRKEP